MKAKFINEIQNFKRGSDPYNKLGIGTLNAPRPWSEIKSQRAQSLSELESKAIEFIESLGVEFGVRMSAENWQLFKKNKDNYYGSGYSNDYLAGLTDVLPLHIRLQFVHNAIYVKIMGQQILKSGKFGKIKIISDIIMI